MKKVFTENGWQDYLFWQNEDKKTLKKINKLIPVSYTHLDVYKRQNGTGYDS